MLIIDVIWVWLREGAWLSARILAAVELSLFRSLLNVNKNVQNVKMDLQILVLIIKSWRSYSFTAPTV